MCVQLVLISFLQPSEPPEVWLLFLDLESDCLMASPIKDEEGCYDCSDDEDLTKL